MAYIQGIIYNGWWLIYKVLYTMVDGLYTRYYIQWLMAYIQGIIYNGWWLIYKVLYIMVDGLYTR